MVATILLNCYYIITRYLSINNHEFKEKSSDPIMIESYKQSEEMDREIYNHELNYYQDENNSTVHKLNKSHSDTVISYSCGYCMSNITIPCYMYNDSVYCNSILYSTSAGRSITSWGVRRMVSAKCPFL